MPPPSTPDTPTIDDPPVEGATHVVEAPTAEDALAQVHERLGPRAQILSARRVVRGGLAGFFGTQHVQLHVAPDAAATTAPPPPTPASEAAACATATPSPVDRLMAGVGQAAPEVEFATYLRERLGAVVAPPEGSRPQAPADADACQEGGEPAGPPGPEGHTGAAGEGGWSVTRLQRLGLPVGLVRSLEVPPPGDDLAWTTALARALRPLCRPLPLGPCVLVGPRAAMLAQALDAPVARSDMWRSALGDGRWRHLVVGGPDWRAHLDDAVLAVSWSLPADLPEALRCASELGLVLGAGPLDGRISRATPLAVALAVRASAVSA